MKRSLGVLAIAAGLFLGGISLPQAQAAPGGLDRSFGEKPGRTILNGPLGQVEASPGSGIAFGDGSTIWQDGYDDRARLIKNLADGTPDRDFGSNGTALTPPRRGDTAWIWGMVRQANWVVLLRYDSDGQVFLERYSAETGQRDNGFGINGIASFDFRVPLETKHMDPDPMSLEADEVGRIYVAASNRMPRSKRAVIRLSPSGKVDQTWGDSGVLLVGRGPCDRSPQGFTPVPSGLVAFYGDCLRLYDQRGDLNQLIELTGFGYFDTDLILPGPADQIYAVDTDDSDFIVGITRVGDASFGTDGLLRPELGEEKLANPTVDQDGRLLMSAGASPESGDSRFEVLRYDLDGNPDPSFGVSGVATVDSSGEQLQPPPLISVPGGTVVRTWIHQRGALKLDQSGSPDPGFGDGGWLAFTATVPPDDRINDTLALPGGRTLVAGQSDDRAVFLRFNANGKLDRSFGDDGWLVIPAIYPGRRNAAWHMNPAPDGSVMACINSPKGSFALKIRRGGTLDPGFGDGGMVRLTGMSKCGGIAVHGEKTLVAGDWQGIRYATVRLTADGGWDKTYGDEGRAWGPKSATRSSLAFIMRPDGSSLVSSAYEIFGFDPAGRPDKSFARDGSAKLPDGGMYSVSSLVINRAGKIYVGGSGSSSPIIYRLTASGKRDRSFGFRSVRILRNPKTKVVTSDFKLQGDGKLVFSAAARSRECRTNCGKLWLYRLKADGTFDRKFGKRGVAEAQFGLNKLASSVSISRRGIVVGGMVETPNGFDDMVLARFKR